MHAVLFTSRPHDCENMVAGLQSENIVVDLSRESDQAYQEHLISGTHFFFFHREMSERDISFSQLVKCLKPTSVTVLLDPQIPDQIRHVDLAFSRPYSYAIISIHLQRKLLEKREQSCPREIQLGSISLHLQKRTLTKGRSTVPLKNKEFSLLQYFFMNDGKILSRSDILEYVWDRNASLTTNTVDVHVSRLRKKLELCDADHYLRTVPCVGYLWSCDAM